MSTDSAKTVALPNQFYVRTLTPNDVEKLLGNMKGTFETDLGETARDSYPSFWGWPDNYKQVVRRKGREEWKANGRLFSADTPPQGIPVTLTLWYREARPGHAAEHRLGLGPIGEVRAAAPTPFNTDSLMLVEPAPQDRDYDFTVRFITVNDPGYDDFARYLTENRPQHRYGYGR